MEEKVTTQVDIDAVDFSDTDVLEEAYTPEIALEARS
jgi:hypothetical protein